MESEVELAEEDDSNQQANNQHDDEEENSNQQAINQHNDEEENSNQQENNQHDEEEEDVNNSPVHEGEEEGEEEEEEEEETKTRGIVTRNQTCVCPSLVTMDFRQLVKRQGVCWRNLGASVTSGVNFNA